MLKPEGFMGKVLIEKLLYSCTDLDRIYLLLRGKKGVKSEDRLADLYSSIELSTRLVHATGDLRAGSYFAQRLSRDPAWQCCQYPGILAAAQLR
ncbi:hypothetical protein MSG28_015442 [Choristoneura fumiferana]|uniref:Uncharacterized protein n=1 Tax=Choristoneura fumiferana TaxID=7141 RepID=A0ACC0KA78_CHOFU|nr:hypothetical protein MSG28_015442 [Choristoneura fumiferana]